MSKLEQARKLLIMALHPGKTYEEALDVELKESCRVKTKEGITVRISGLNHAGNYTTYWDVGKYSIQRTLRKKDIGAILGLPLTIGRVMQAFRNNNLPLSLGTDGELYANCLFTNEQPPETLLQFTKGDGFTEATIDDQTEEVWDAIISLLPPNTPTNE